MTSLWYYGGGMGAAALISSMGYSAAWVGAVALAILILDVAFRVLGVEI